MTIAVVAVKDLRLVKSRLAPRFSPDLRRDLALAMLGDVLATLSRVAELQGLLVVTPSKELSRLASDFGAEVLEDARGEGYTQAIDLAARELSRRGVSSMLAIPGDVPCLTPEEVIRVLASRGPPPSAVLVPSHDDRGTNAALVSPPTALPLRFGEPSFWPHVERARELGLHTEVLRLPGLSLDLDTSEDIDRFVKRQCPTRTYELLLSVDHR